jgi:hypothetical protein
MYYDVALMAPTLAASATTIRKLRNIGNPKPDDDGARLAHFRSAAVTGKGGRTMKEGNACGCMCISVYVCVRARKGRRVSDAASSGASCCALR